jgi:hypothetical protein
MNEIIISHADGTCKHEISFREDLIDIKFIKIWNVGRSSICFTRKIEKQQVCWEESDSSDKIIHVPPEIQTQINKIVKLRAFL